MRNLNKPYLISIIILVFILCTTIAKATVTASIDKPSMLLGDTMQLSIYGDNLSANAVPDLSNVVDDFNLLSSSQTQQVAMVNNRMTSETVWIFVLSPKRAGSQVIPPISVGTQQTAPLTINVTDPGNAQPNEATPSDQTQPAQTAPKNVDNTPSIFIKADLSPPSPYVQAEAIYTLRLFYNKQIVNPQMGIPSVDGANFIRIGDNRIYQKTINNRSYQVIEMKYAVFPEKEGILTIKGPEFSGDVVLNDNRSFLIGGTKPIQAQGNTIMINVKPIPVTAQNTWWLPADDVQISEKWSADLNNLRAGVPVTRTITLAAKGTTATQLPTMISTDVPGFQVYPDKPTLTSSSDGETVFGTRIEKAAYIPSESGSVNIPAIKISWWNTRTNTLESAILPAKTLTILNGQGGTEPTVGATPPVSSKPVEKITLTKKSLIEHAQTANNWFWVALSLVIVWFITVMAFLIYMKKRKIKKNSVTQPAEAKPLTGESFKILKARMDQAVKAHDPQQFATALIALAKHVWPESEILSLADIVKKCQTAAAKEAILGLDALRYSYTSTSWQADITWKMISKELVKTTEQSDRDEDALPDLYPNNRGIK